MTEPDKTTKARGCTWPVVFVALLVGGSLAAVLVNVWTQCFRYRYLEKSAWNAPADTGEYAGSVSCRECHERFYKLWSPSHHGKAMQPMTEALVEELTPLEEAVTVGAASYSIDLKALVVQEEKEGIRRSYPMVHAMGGKNVFFFLTPLDRGRLQVLPLSYDVRRKEWFDTTASMVRHFAETQDTAIDWRDPLLTFNTACYNCHVSQLSKNYDSDTDTYHTTWREPGINCEACHGPSEEHNRVCKAVPKGTVPKNLRTILWSKFSHEQKNDACAPCHAKMRQIAPSFKPGEHFFDHYDLVCLEDHDFYPDGRDLGENYTQTLWMLNPCAQSGMLDCLHCHTSSGRFRQKDDPNSACLPCHATRVRDVAKHSRHAQKEGAPTCVSCHMPMTEFSRMKRSDHSFRPPCPDASIRFKSPNSCILCHKGKTNEWAAACVRQWHPKSRWREKILSEGNLVAKARKGDWKVLPEMVAYMVDPASEEIVVTSLTRLLAECPDGGKWPAIRTCVGHRSALVRGAAVAVLQDDVADSASLRLLLAALQDDSRLVRVRAVAALAGYPRDDFGEDVLQALKHAEEELLASFSILPDSWSSHYNLGNYRGAQGDLHGALAAYDRAIGLREDVVVPYVNAAVTASQLGKLQKSVDYLERACRADPENGAVNLNLGLAMAEKGAMDRAEKHLRVAMRSADARGQAAYNLAVLVAKKDRQEAVRLCRTAVKSTPDNPRYAYTLAFYLAEDSTSEATTILRDTIEKHPQYVDAWMLLGQCYLRLEDVSAARQHYADMQNEKALPPEARTVAGQYLERLRQ